MKVILKESVKNLGSMGDTVTVKPGYARNFLFPKGLAAEATEANQKLAESLKKQLALREVKQKEEAKAAAEKLAVLAVTIHAKAGEEGKLFGSVTTMDIEEALRAQGVDVDRKRIVLEEPIKRTGTFTVQIKIHPEVTATLTIEVVPE
jgi:large subunit ribosomal protein L9